MSIALRLKVVSFLQHLIQGSWLTTLSSYMINTLHFTDVNIGMIYNSKGIAAIIMLGIMGIITDKWLRAERAYMLYHLVRAGVLFYAAPITDPDMMLWVILVNAIASVPTIVLSNSVSYPCPAQTGLDPVTAFPSIRVFDMVGFIVTTQAVGLLHLELSSLQLYIASGASLLLLAYVLVLPETPVAEKKVTTSLASKLGLDAFVLSKNPRIAIFFLFVMILGAVLQITNVLGNPFLYDFAHNSEFADSLVMEYPSILLSVSQVVEVDFILTMPFSLERFGAKTIMLMSMVAQALCLGFFAYSDPSPTGSILLLLSVIVYGCTFDFFNISGLVFVEQEVGSSVHAGAQGLFMIMISGVGAWADSILSGMVVDCFSMDGVKDQHTIWLIFIGYVFFLAVILFFGLKCNHDPGKITHYSVTH